MQPTRLHLLIIFLFFTVPLHGQIIHDLEEIESAVEKSDVKMKIYFLAADEFLGRDTGTPQLDIASRYIATWFMTNGVKPFPELDDYYQTIRFLQIDAPESGNLAIGDSTYHFPEDFIMINPARGIYNGPLAVLEHGTREELEGVDLEGKVVVTRPGGPEMQHPQEWLSYAEEKRKEMTRQGAAALIELYDSPLLPWQLVVQYLNQPWTEVEEDQEDGEPIPHIWFNGTQEELLSVFRGMEGSVAALSIDGREAERFTSNNVVGYIEGSDPELKEQYLLLTAHYDHVGVDTDPEGDNHIYNGARDNAVGTAAIMLAARYFANHPPKRSVIVAAWTAEEIGLLGSDYFAEHPPLPLEKIIYNLNIDGAGYNDTTKVTVIGLERTGAEEDLRNAATSFGLEAIPDPVPEQNLFDRSDNVSFARRGVPAPTYSLGLTAFDEEIATYYHTVKDEADTIDYPYITRYIRSFLLAAQLIANAEEAPFWIEGDFYEEVGRELYGRE